ncbi:MAG TPA: sulfite exporter TauE/SafE family protein [Acidobacteriaceae bacterium]|jgi:hypothetical protein|nr:sulfite exporter TauE/SafE family protein [Acidobacteriaceae bacterium]
MAIFESWRGLWLIAASLIAGALNAVAGGGSFLSFPALLGAGVLPVQANATNTVALWPGQATSIAGYLHKVRQNRGLLLPACSAAAVGGLAGAILLLHTGQATFMALVPWLLLFATVLFAASAPISRWLEGRATEPAHRTAPISLWAGIAVICVYIGYFGAGAGFLLMSVFALFGMEDIHKINALKVVTTTVANGIAVLAFIAGRKIEWRYCLLMMAAAAVGGFLGARFSQRLNPLFLRVAIVLIGLGMAAYFFYA